MSQSLVIAKVFWNAPDAHIAKAQLDGAGLDCLLADENTVTMDWMLCNAVGGIKLMVQPQDLGRARGMLEEKQALAAEDADPMPAHSRREEMARDALRAAMLGYLFAPISLYALWLALKSLAGEGPLDIKGKWRLLFAFVLVAPPWVLAWMLLRLILFPMGSFPHPG